MMCDLAVNELELEDNMKGNKRSLCSLQKVLLIGTQPVEQVHDAVPVEGMSKKTASPSLQVLICRCGQVKSHCERAL